jgi:hypothetical protein
LFSSMFAFLFSSWEREKELFLLVEVPAEGAGTLQMNRTSFFNVLSLSGLFGHLKLSPPPPTLCMKLM